MLRPKALSSSLNHYVGSGVDSILLFTSEGILLAQSNVNSNGEKTKAAIVANIWNIYQRQQDNVTVDDQIQELLIEFESGKLAISKVGNVLLCLCGSDSAEFGMIRAKMNTLIERLTEPLSKLTGF